MTTGRARPRVGVLALQGDVREHAIALESCGAHPVAVRGPADLAGIGGLVLPGGESTTISLLLRSSGLAQEVAAMVRDGVPFLGTCAGMILLARQVLDGRADQLSFGAIDISVRRNAFGRQVESFETDLEVSGLSGGPMHAVFIRAPLVEDVGPKVEVLARVARGRGVAPAADQAGGPAGTAAGAGTSPVACREGRVTVTAFHPELAGDLRLHQLLLRDVEGA